MKINPAIHAVLSLLLIIALSGCEKKVETIKKQNAAELPANRGEHARDGGEDSGELGGEQSEEHDGKGSGEHDGDGLGEHGEEGEEGEESGTEYALNQTYDNVRNGARCILSYDTLTNSFVGTVENTTGRILESVRVEVHRSNGMELGPTSPFDLKPGEKRAVRLSASGKTFEKWSAHPEVGGGEHSEDDYKN